MSKKHFIALADELRYERQQFVQNYGEGAFDAMLVRDAIADRDLPKGTYGTFFEHGQWWIEEKRSGAQYSVCDAEPGPFCFEQVTVGEEL